MTAHDIRIARETEMFRRRERKDIRRRNRKARQRNHSTARNFNLLTTPAPKVVAVVERPSLITSLFRSIRSMFRSVIRWALSPWELPRMV